MHHLKPSRYHQWTLLNLLLRQNLEETSLRSMRRVISHPLCQQALLEFVGTLIYDCASVFRVVTVTVCFYLQTVGSWYMQMSVFRIICLKILIFKLINEIYRTSSVTRSEGFRQEYIPFRCQLMNYSIKHILMFQRNIQSVRNFHKLCH